MKNFRAGTVSGVLLHKIEKSILVEGKHPSILILRHRRQNSIFFDSRRGGGPPHPITIRTDICATSRN
jgi:hypothetical protein